MDIFTLDDYFLYLHIIYVYTEYTGLINWLNYAKYSQNTQIRQDQEWINFLSFHHDNIRVERYKP